MRSYWKIKLWTKFVNHFDVFDNLWSRKTQCDRSTCYLWLDLTTEQETRVDFDNGLKRDSDASHIFFFIYMLTSDIE